MELLYDNCLPKMKYLRRLEFWDCDKLKPSVEWGLQGLVSLEEFAIAGEISAPLLKEQMLPATLKHLRIAGHSSLKSVDVKGL
ncbi:disease resistance RPP13-like protein 1 [Pyrus ussuriensis x Pyrus communis]|uniref:Disease resistance RPP13-like protein 1 n=1 Tax=Pyrus ussuriensis x Pyrus communis TaxID=2448454 RepID=A0A5N5FVD3_9ROSA|nr:disease resistance RPP13-like protein 1 [Pyrus ussuriensis x Pyrus communis]